MAQEQDSPQVPRTAKMILIPKAFERVADVASKDENRSALCGVHVKATDAGVIIEATDGARMIRATVPTPFKPEDFPTIAGFDANANGAQEAIIPLDAWKKAFKAVPKPKYRPILGCLALTMEQAQVTFASTDLQSASITPVKPVDGNYPNIDQVMPKDEPTFAIAFDANILADTLKALAALADDGHKPMVRFEFHGSEKATKVVVSHSKESAQVEALVMPMRDK
ncbi:MAG TPA: hypothetical protein VKT83_07315 [bacterium]|nr:hypothetical protein [bacterium]